MVLSRVPSIVSMPPPPRQGWFLTDFASALAIVGAYLVLATVGPLIMSILPPIDSYPVRFVYNVVQVIDERMEAGA